MMLARRFTIVCMLLAVFGMWFASLAANADRRTSIDGRHYNCIQKAPIGCRLFP